MWAANTFSVLDAEPGFLALADGRVFSGWVQKGKLVQGEVVFNTAMTGYQEMLTDPSYRGQILVLTTPHVGVVGTNSEDRESDGAGPAGLVVQDLEPMPSNWRSQESLLSLLERKAVPVGLGFDTRAIVLHLRQYGALPGALVATSDPEEARRRAREAVGTEGQDLTHKVAMTEHFRWSEPPWRGKVSGAKARIGVLDFGVKHTILRELMAAGAEVQVIPGRWDARSITALDQDGLVVSNGPGDPAAVVGAVRTLRQLLGRKPILGICLGHQLLALALGGKTYRMPFGHHGANHPVKVLKTGRVWITSQNHNYAVDAFSLSPGVEVTMANLTDGTVEGLAAADHLAVGVQFHPEAGPGPHDALPLFQEFVLQCLAFREGQGG